MQLYCSAQCRAASPCAVAYDTAYASHSLPARISDHDSQQGHWSIDIETPAVHKLIQDRLHLLCTKLEGRDERCWGNGANGKRAVLCCTQIGDTNATSCTSQVQSRVLHMKACVRKVRRSLAMRAGEQPGKTTELDLCLTRKHGAAIATFPVLLPHLPRCHWLKISGG